MKTLPLPPKAYSLISATRHIGYSLEAAVADLVDNSIAAGARTVNIFFANAEHPFIAILDDGCGMSETELTRAMQYGSADPLQARTENDLGRYGLGLKTASMSQCKTMTVISKVGESVSACRWDLNYIETHQEENWPLLKLSAEEWNSVPETDKLLGLKAGTLVVWQNIDFGGTFDARTFDEKMATMTDEHLALVFHRYIQGEDGIQKLTIKSNGRTLKSKDPFLQYVQDGKRGHQCKATQVFGEGEEQITIQPFVLPYDKELTPEMRRLLGAGNSLRRSQGFYIYRNKRLITYGNWFGIKAQGEFFKLARVKVDIRNSSDFIWSLDVKKSVAIPPKKVADCLKAYVDSVTNSSKESLRTQAVGRKVRQPKPDEQVWDIVQKGCEITAVSINKRHPVIKEALESKRISENFLRLLEKTIPVDAFYYSRSGETKLSNEEPVQMDELMAWLKDYVNDFPPGAPRRDAFRSVISCDPFSAHSAFFESKEQEMVDETL